MKYIGLKIKFWVRDIFFNKAEVLRNLSDIRRKMTRKKFRECVLKQSDKQLKKILKYAIEHTEYYSSLNVQKRNTTVPLSLALFPVMTKATLNADYDKHISDEYINKKVHKMFTSGSTGIPFCVQQNHGKRVRHIADLKYFGELAGYRDHDSMCYLRAKPTATEKEQSEQNIFQLDITSLSDENLSKYYKIMCEKRCTALMAYPSTLEQAVLFWSKHFKNETYIQTIISTSETLTQEIRDELYGFFGDKIHIVARYSNTEQGVLGQETEFDKYVLNWASYYFEILKMDKDEPAGYDELGRIVITDLYNKAFPLIRYDTGDVAKIKIADGLPYFTDLFGRRMDMIYNTQGKPVSPFLLCRVMRLAVDRNIDQWQFIQNNARDYCLKIASKEKPDLSKELELFSEVLGKDANIIVVYTDDIPILNSLKRKLIVSKYSISAGKKDNTQ